MGTNYNHVIEPKHPYFDKLFDASHVHIEDLQAPSEEEKERFYEHYLLDKPIETHVTLQYHIGKLSAGWQFIFRGYYNVIESFADLKQSLSLGGHIIEAGEDEKLSIKTFLQLVENQRNEKNHYEIIKEQGDNRSTDAQDKSGNPFIYHPFS